MVVPRSVTHGIVLNRLLSTKHYLTAILQDKVSEQRCQL